MSSIKNYIDVIDKVVNGGPIRDTLIDYGVSYDSYFKSFLSTVFGKRIKLSDLKDNGGMVLYMKGKPMLDMFLNYTWVVVEVESYSSICNHEIWGIADATSITNEYIEPHVFPVSLNKYLLDKLISKIEEIYMAYPNVNISLYNMDTPYSGFTSLNKHITKPKDDIMPNAPSSITTISEIIMSKVNRIERSIREIKGIITDPTFGEVIDRKEYVLAKPNNYDSNVKNAHELTLTINLQGSAYSYFVIPLGSRGGDVHFLTDNNVDVMHLLGCCDDVKEIIKKLAVNHKFTTGVIEDKSTNNITITVYATPHVPQSKTHIEETIKDNNMYTQEEVNGVVNTLLNIELPTQRIMDILGTVLEPLPGSDIKLVEFVGLLQEYLYFEHTKEDITSLILSTLGKRIPEDQLHSALEQLEIYSEVGNARINNSGDFEYIKPSLNSFIDFQSSENLHQLGGARLRDPNEPPNGYQGREFPLRAPTSTLTGQGVIGALADRAFNIVVIYNPNDYTEIDIIKKVLFTFCPEAKLKTPVRISRQISTDSLSHFSQVNVRGSVNIHLVSMSDDKRINRSILLANDNSKVVVVRGTKVECVVNDLNNGEVKPIIDILSNVLNSSDVAGAKNTDVAS